MKVFITGATGFVGSHVADEFLRHGYEIKCLARKTSDLRWLKDKNVELAYASLSDRDSLIPHLEDVDTVVHVAGVTAAKNYAAFYEGNVKGTESLLEAAGMAGGPLKRFVHISSQTVCGPAKSLDRPVTESDPLHPITSYGITKKLAEDVVNSYGDKFPVTIVRPPAVYGPRDTAILTVFQAAAKGIGTLIGLKSKYVSLINGLDLAKGIYAAATSDKAAGETYFITSKEFYNWNQIADLMGSALGRKRILKIKIPHSLVFSLGHAASLLNIFSRKPSVFNHEKARDFVQSYWICSPDKAKEHLGFEQGISIEEGIRSTIEWYRENKWL